jgi:hypothetical protein
MKKIQSKPSYKQKANSGAVLLYCSICHKQMKSAEQHRMHMKIHEMSAREYANNRNY